MDGKLTIPATNGHNYGHRELYIKKSFNTELVPAICSCKTGGSKRDASEQIACSSGCVLFGEPIESEGKTSLTICNSKIFEFDNFEIETE